MAGPAILLRSEGAVVEVNDPNSSDGFIEIPGVSGYTEQGGEATSREVTSFSGTRAVSGLPGVGTVQFTYASYLPHHPANRTILSAKADGRTLQFRATTPVEAVAAAYGTGTSISVATTGIVSQPAASGADSVFDFTSDDLGPGLVLALFTATGSAVNGALDEDSEAEVAIDGTAPSPAFGVGDRISFGQNPPSYTVRKASATALTLDQPLSAAVADDAVISRAATGVLYVVESISEGGILKVAPKPSAATTAVTFAQLLIPRLRRSFTASVQNAGSWELGDQSQLGSTMTLQPVAALADPTALY